MITRSRHAFRVRGHGALVPTAIPASSTAAIRNRQTVSANGGEDLVAIVPAR